VTISFFVPGMPGTKGSTKAFVIPGTNRATIVNDNRKTKPWAAEVSRLARLAMGSRAALLGDVIVRVVFNMPRPKSHYMPATKKRPAPVLREDAPRYVTTKPDGDKMERATLDALTGIVFVDDAQIVECTWRKVYARGADGLGEVGTLIEIGQPAP